MHRNVSDLLRRGGAVVYVAPDSTVAEAVHQMMLHNVSSILVLENYRQLVGIFTERDLLRRVVAQGKDPAATPIGDVMTRDVLVVSSATPRTDVMRLMNEHHIRHVPIAEGNLLLGVVSLRDLLRFENSEKDFEIEQLRGYILQQPLSVSPSTA